jgi:arginine utilization regulatory protein
VIRQAVTLARVPFPLLITGETGTGKKILARALYLEGGYRGKMICLNINTVPHELFGERAVRPREGRLYRGGERQLRQGGPGRRRPAVSGRDWRPEPRYATKLLARAARAHLLPVGGKHEMHTNARFVFATNRDLRRAVAEGAFREDLYYRISTFCIQIPPLRERPGHPPAGSLLHPASSCRFNRRSSLAPSPRRCGDLAPACDWRR